MYICKIVCEDLIYVLLNHKIYDSKDWFSNLDAKKL